jgi:hypothetical protein
VSCLITSLANLVVEENIRLPEVWGEDADQWNPHRFDHVDQKKQVSVGLYANL